MKIIVCLDDNGGMMFNHRRQSRDRLVTADILDSSRGKKLYIDEYSQKLFADLEGSYTVSDNMLEDAGEGDVCFVENKAISHVIGRIEEITVYRWNRVYPADTYFDIDLVKEGFVLRDTRELEGNSHEKITKETFTR